jgi:hypothetical protein
VVDCLAGGNAVGYWKSLVSALVTPLPQQETTHWEAQTAEMSFLKFLRLRAQGQGAGRLSLSEASLVGVQMTPHCPHGVLSNCICVLVSFSSSPL